MNTDNKTLFWLGIAASLMSIFVGLVTIGTLLFKGGAVVEVVKQLEIRVSKIESNGSPPISEHIKLDDLRDRTTREQLARFESTCKSMDEVRITVSAIPSQLDLLKEQITELRNLFKK